MFPFCHNSCWLLDKSFANCENLTDYCSKQQAVIRKLQMEDASNKIEIDNLKHMLEMLNKVEGVIKAA